MKDIRNKKYRIKYFYLESPAKNNDNYYEGQEIIKEEYNSMIPSFKTKNKNQQKKQIENYLKEKKKKAEDKEISIMHLHEDYRKLTDKEKVKLWTRFFLKIDSDFPNKIKKMKPVDCFSLLIRSVEFYNKLKASNREIFSRHNLLNIQGQTLSRDIDKKMFETINSFFQENLQSFIKEFNTITNQQIKGLETINTVSKKFNDSSSYKIAASTFSKKIRDELREMMIEYNNKVKREEDKKTSIQLKGVSGEYALEIYLEGAENELYKNQKNISKENKIDRQYRNELIEKTIEVFSKVIKSFSPPEGSSGNYILNLKGLGTLTLDHNTMRYLKTCALRYIQGKGVENNFKKFLSNSSDIVRTFKAANSNAYISGLLGELSAALAFNGQMTGNLYSEIKGVNYGQSATDILVQGNKDNPENKNTIAYGVNVKHYITNDNSITLYKTNDFLDLSSPYIKKYYSEEEIKIMKWAYTNRKFLQKMAGISALDYMKSYTWENFASFLRVEDHSDQNISNLFFQLNNQIFPLSVIYSKVIENAHEANNINKDSLFDFKISKVKDSINYFFKDEQDLNNSIISTSQYLSEYKIDKLHGNNTMKVKMKGLSINLVKLNLFKEVK